MAEAVPGTRPTVLIVALVISILIAATFAGLFVWKSLPPASGPAAAPPQIQVLAVNYLFSACWTATDVRDTPYVTAGAPLITTLELLNQNRYNCTITAVESNTSGLPVTGANLPLSVSVGAAQVLSVTLSTPNLGWTGVLTLVVTAKVSP
jgi:hypothetical protein